MRVLPGSSSVPEAHGYAGVAPIGTGTPFVESLSGYLQRLANIYEIPPATLFQQAILPVLREHGLWKAHLGDLLNRHSYAMNGTGEAARLTVDRLSHLTGRQDLSECSLMTVGELGLVHQRGTSRHGEALVLRLLARRRWTGCSLRTKVVGAFGGGSLSGARNGADPAVLRVRSPSTGHRTGRLRWCLREMWRRPLCSRHAVDAPRGARCGAPVLVCPGGGLLAGCGQREPVAGLRCRRPGPRPQAGPRDTFGALGLGTRAPCCRTASATLATEVGQTEPRGSVQRLVARPLARREAVPGRRAESRDGAARERRAETADRRRDRRGPYPSSARCEASRVPRGAPNTDPQALQRGVALFLDLVAAANRGEAAGISYVGFIEHVYARNFVELSGRPWSQGDVPEALSLADQVTAAAGGRRQVTRGSTAIAAAMDTFIWRAAPPHERPSAAWDDGLPYSREDWLAVFPETSRRLLSGDR